MMVACLQSLHLTNALVIILAATGAKLLVARCPPAHPPWRNPVLHGSCLASNGECAATAAEGRKLRRRA